STCGWVWAMASLSCRACGSRDILEGSKWTRNEDGERGFGPVNVAPAGGRGERGKPSGKRPATSHPPQVLTTAAQRFQGATGPSPRPPERPVVLRRKRIRPDKHGYKPPATGHKPIATSHPSHQLPFRHAQVPAPFLLRPRRGR